MKFDLLMPQKLKMKEKKIVIVGAGIVGVTLAWYFATYSDAEVTLLDQKQAGSGVSQHSFAWLNVSYGRPDAYQKLRSKSLNEWRRLDAEMRGALKIHWRGAISWQETNAETLQFIQSHSEQSFNVESLTKENLAKKEPLLDKAPNVVAFAGEEGAIDPIWVIQTLLQDAIKKGVTYCPETEVSKILQNESGQTIGVRSQDKDYVADKVVLTAGVVNKDLLQTINIELPLASLPAIIIRFKHEKSDQFAQHIISTPEMEIRSIDSEHFLAAEDYIDDTAANTPELIALNALKTIQAHFNTIAPALASSITVDHVAVGMRPIPFDDMPIVGTMNDDSGLYLISMHAAVTLAPLISRLAMQEILYEQESPELFSYRITRFQ